MALREALPTPSLLGKALDWGAPTPRLVQYLGRVEKDEGVEAVVFDGASREIVPHATVFCFAGVCSGRDVPFCQLSPRFGMA